eukprot:EG_transcript_4314
MAVAKSGQLGLRGLYRFTNEEWEEQYRTRMADWRFWPTILLLYLQLVFDSLDLSAYLGITKLLKLGATSPDPTAVCWDVAVDSVALTSVITIHCCPVVRRHILLVQSGFIALLMAKVAFYITFHTEIWTEHSYRYLVPAGSAILISGPNGQVDVSSKLWDHLATLASFRAMHIAFLTSFPPWVFNTLMGLSWWSLGTSLCIALSLIVGMAVNPVAQWPPLLINSAMAAGGMALSVFFAAAFERMQRRNFEAERLLQWELHASQMADGVLNHSLKNTLADVAGNIEMFLAGAMQSQVLEDCIVSLRRGVRSCKERQGYLQLVAGQYHPVLNALNLQDFGRQLLAGRNATGQFLDCTIYADHMLLTLIFDNALSNAAKHGNPQHADVSFVIEEIPADICTDLEAGKRRISFQVTNIAHPGNPELTPEFVRQLFAGGTEQHCRRLVSTLSDGIGLTHCVMAARLAGVALSLSQEDHIVTFTGILDAEVQAPPALRLHPPDSVAPDAAVAFPAGLRFTVLDDSLPAQRLLRFHIERLCAPASVVCLGASAADIELFMTSALAADVVIVDQHLDWNRESYLGTNLVRELRTLQYGGFICVRSADDGPEDQALFLRSGANCSVGKDLLGPVMVRQLQADYAAFLARRGSDGPSTSADPTPPTHTPPPPTGLMALTAGRRCSETRLDSLTSAKSSSGDAPFESLMAAVPATPRHALHEWQDGPHPHSLTAATVPLASSAGP